MDFYQKLVDLGLVRVKLGPESLGAGVPTEGTFWWVGRVAAEDLVRAGKAELVPLPPLKET